MIGKMKKMIFFTMIVLTGALVNCAEENDSYPRELVSFSNFEDSTFNNWMIGFAQYPEGLEDSFRLSYRIGAFNLGNTAQKALIIRGKNWNKDLFMYTKGKIGGFLPETYYDVVIIVELYALLLETYSGDLDSEFLGSFIKVGAFTDEPVSDKSPHSENPGQSIVTLNIDIGSANENGYNIQNLGKLFYSEMYNAPTGLRGDNSEDMIRVKTNEAGEIWLIVGIHSNVEVYQDVLINFIGARYYEMD